MFYLTLHILLWIFWLNPAAYTLLKESNQPDEATATSMRKNKNKEAV